MAKPETTDPATFIDHALAVLGTETGESRMRQHLTRAASEGCGETIEVGDLIEALRELRRRS